jgi:predicted MFS family arabinose efflux permease
MWAGEIGRGLLIGTWVFASTDVDYLWVFYVVALLHGLIGTLFYPARAAIFPLIMNKSELAIGNALLNAGIVFALIFGSLMAGVTVEVIGSQWAFAIDASTFIVSGLLILMMKIPRHATAPTALSGDQVRAELREGLHYVWYTPSVRYIMGLSLAVAFGLGGGIILMMDYLEAQLNVGTAQFGLVISVMGIGFVVGSLIIRRLSHRLSTNQLVAMAMTLDGLALSFFVFDPALFFVLILAAVVGFSVVISRAVLSTLTQVIPPDSLQGRIQGLFDLLFQAPLVLSIGLAGIALTIFSSGVVFLGYGMMLILSAFVALWTLRGIDEIIYADN